MISTLNKISNSHNSCEDSFQLWHEDNVIFGAVSDGCSTGKNSHFASQLYCKCSAPNRYPFLSDLHVINIYYKLEQYKKELNLDASELWATLILFSYNLGTETLRIRCFGDGVYYVNNFEYNIDQNDKVHYLMDQKDILSYLEFYIGFTYSNVKNFRICSDGIKSLVLPSLRTSNLENPKELLLSPNQSKNHLDRKYNILRKQNWINTDDLTIIAYDSI